MDRRSFLKKSSAAAGGLGILPMCEMISPDNTEAFPTSGGMGVEEALYHVERGKDKNIQPEIIPEIRNNPRAVFLIKTHVDACRDKSGHFTEAAPQLEAEGKRIAGLLFERGSEKGGSTFIKPNFTYVPEHCYNRTTGVYSSPDFIAGVTRHLHGIGNTNVVAGEGPTNSRNHRNGGIYGAFDSVGLNMIEAGYERFSHFRKNELNWAKADNSLVWKRIPYFRPVGDKDNFLINISSMKCHLTGLTTLTVKNLQGLVPVGYGQFCTPWNDVEARAYRDGINFKRDFRGDYFQRVEASFLKHRAAGFKRWDHTGSYKRYEEKGGWEAFRKVKDDREARNEFMEDVGSLMQHEIWLQRGLDNAFVVKPRLNIIEGIIGLDGEELNRQKIGDDQLVNLVIAGISPFEVDAVGSYCMGHDPREIWYTRVAKEKGYGECDVNNIEMYWISENGEIAPVKSLSEIKRHPLGLNWSRLKNPDERLFW